MRYPFKNIRTSAREEGMQNRNMEMETTLHKKMMES